MSSPRARVLVVGIDAADPDLLREGARRGRYPNIAKFFGEGAFGPTTNPRGLYVGAVWPSFITGVSPARHGRYCYSQIRRGTYDGPRFRPEDLKHEPFWNPLSRAGRKVAVLDVPKTYPTEGLEGLQLCDWGTHDPEGEPKSWPPGFAAEVKARFGPDPVGGCDHPNRGLEGFVELRDRLIDRAHQRAEMVRHYLRQESWDLFLTVFSETHCVGHQCWHHHDALHPDHDPTVRETIGDPLEAVYEGVDRSVGSVLDGVGPETTVILLASHGMGPHYDGTFLLPEMLRRIQDPPRSALRQTSGALLARVWINLPRGLRRALAPLRDQIRAPLAEALPSTEMEGARRCFAVLNNDAYGAIRLNLKGREPHGQLQPGPEVEAFCRELTLQLCSFVREDTRTPLVRRVLRTRDLFEGDHIDDLPDLIVEWDRTAPVHAIVSPTAGRIEGRFQGTRTGDHRDSGLWLARGPGIEAGEHREPVSVMDFAPTVGALLGVPLSNLDGRPIDALLSRGPDS